MADPTVSTVAKSMGTVSRNYIDITSNFATTSTTYVDVTNFAFAVSIPQNYYWCVWYSASHSVSGETEYFKILETSSGSNAWEWQHQNYGTTGTDVRRCSGSTTAGANPQPGYPAGSVTAGALINTTGHTITNFKLQTKGASGQTITVYRDSWSVIGARESGLLVVSELFAWSGISKTNNIYGKRMYTDFKGIEGTTGKSYYGEGAIGAPSGQRIQINLIVFNQINLADVNTININAMANQISLECNNDTPTLDLWYSWSGYHIQVS